MCPKISQDVREERRETILNATVRCLAELGYAGTNMRTIAEAAQLTKGGLYAYFNSKEAILLEVAERYMERQLAEFRSHPSEGAREQLRRLVTYDGAASLSTTVQRAILDLWAFAGELPAVREALARRYERYLTATADVIRKGQAEGAFRPDADPELVAGLILSARDGMVYQAVKLALPVPVAELSALLNLTLQQYLSH